MPSIVMLLGRILLSAIFIQSGISGLLNISGTISYFESLHVFLPSVTTWFVIALEVLGGIAILVGYRIRIAASLLCVFSIAAAFIGHSDFADFMQFQMFMKDLAIAGGFLYIAANGAGMLSFDARRD